jgi:hypothetical protein
MKQDSFDAIAETEHALVAKASESYGSTFDVAQSLSMLFTGFIKSIDDPERFIFVAFHSQAKKHLILALLSAVRRHHVQTGVNMRHVLEAGAWAAYAMVHTGAEMFCEIDEHGYMDVPKRLEKARNAWLEKHHPTKSNELERLKKIINASLAHSNVIQASSASQMRDVTDPGFDTPFFDPENGYQIRSDLWFIGNTAMGLTDLLVAINREQKVFQLIDGFDDQFSALSAESNRQRLEMMNSPEYKRAKTRGGGPEPDSSN